VISLSAEQIRLIINTGIGFSLFKRKIEMEQLRKKHMEYKKEQEQRRQEAINIRSQRRFKCAAEDAEFEECE